ncbi:hypothetical protein RHGRI_028928 [Rhododendron griersonianum]|uniref:Uncharacterized protein n=1 Tax=Rhododendron griersonianum TaxID=479676 RepID=A0AAV6IHJ7_9ERIC|nr:hypothetical protein RHGRI_028928 [Rhododendron griersonianum]
MARKFQFFHMPGLLAVEVKVKESSSVVNCLGIPETLMPPEVCIGVQDVDVPMVNVSYPLSPPQMGSLSNCVFVSPMLEPRHLSFEDSSSDRVGDVL